MKRVLLTGATGFIGRQCPPLLLSHDYEVHAVSSRVGQSNEPAVHWHRADLLDQQQVERVLAEVRPTHLLHFAWIVEPGVYWTSPQNFRWVQASLDITQSFAQHGGQRVVMAGTCAEYDWRYGYCSENVTPLQPHTPYGVCKRALHLMLESFAAQRHLSAAWGRIFSPYGPHEYSSRLVPSVARALLRGEEAHCSHGRQIRDFLHVEDVADAFVTLLESDVNGAVNIGSGQPVALRDIVGHIAEIVGRPELVRLGALPAAENEPPLLVADIRRLRDEVGWSPRYDLKPGLEHAVNWWKSDGIKDEQ